MLELDFPGEIRDNEKIDIKILSEILKNKFGSSSNSLEIKQYRKGYSNLTYNLLWNNKEFILRKAPFGALVKGGHDMKREFNILSRLSLHYDKVPKTYFYFDDKSIIDFDFYLMEKLEGIILRPKTLNSMMPEKDVTKKLSVNFIKTLSSLHKLDFKKIDLEFLGKGNGYAKRQVVGWSERYNKSKTDEIKEMEYLMNWLLNNLPKEVNYSLIHNDFKYDNIVLNKDDYSDILGVLDWEMSTIGDPLFDLGTTLGYWVQNNDHPLLKEISLSPTTSSGNLNRMELIDNYEKYSKIKVNDPVYYYVFGLFKISVIVQQIYFRYKKGYTKDDRFSNLLSIVKVCSLVAYQAINRNKIDDLF